MNNLILLERVVAIFCLGHLFIDIMLALEGIRTAVLLKRNWKAELHFTTIAAFTLSVCAVVRWVIGG